MSKERGNNFNYDATVVAAENLDYGQVEGSEVLNENLPNDYGSDTQQRLDFEKSLD